jgi:flagellar basal-body rod protein FlgB
MAPGAPARACRNVANADTPGYRARDLRPPNFERMLETASVALATTNPTHIAAGSSALFSEDNDPHYEVRPRGNAVSHEDEMLKLASNQMDYHAAASIYTHSLSLIKTAFGKA